MRLIPAIRPIAGLAAALLLASGAAVRADALAPGLWEVVSRPEINGVTGPQSQTTRCLTPQDVSDLERTFSPISRTTNSTCERVEHESTPQRLKWHLQCTGQLDMDVAGEFVFENPEHYTALVSVRSSMLGRLMQDVRTRIEGRRLGECR